jgi:hypothetical protein
MKILPIIHHSGNLNLAGVLPQDSPFKESFFLSEMETLLTWNSGTVERMSIMMEASRKMELTITNTSIKKNFTKKVVTKGVNKKRAANKSVFYKVKEKEETLSSVPLLSFS